LWRDLSHDDISYHGHTKAWLRRQNYSGSFILDVMLRVAASAGLWVCTPLRALWNRTFKFSIVFDSASMSRSWEEPVPFSSRGGGKPVAPLRTLTGVFTLMPHRGVVPDASARLLYNQWRCRTLHRLFSGARRWSLRL